jgi:uncharacterized protein YraI
MRLIPDGDVTPGPLLSEATNLHGESCRRAAKEAGALERSLMKIAKVAALAGFGLLALAGVQAHAEAWSGYVVDNVNERAGPSTDYPAVVVIPAGSPVVIYGCLADYTWCDVAWGPSRGWVAASYVQVSYDSEPVPLDQYIVPLGVPIIGFDFDTYWGDYYRGRPFFGDAYRWRHMHSDHYRLPPRPRDYGPPRGFKPPYGYNPPNGQDHFPPKPYGQYQGRDHDNFPPQGPNNYGQPKPQGTYKPWNNNGMQQNGQYGNGKPQKYYGGDSGMGGPSYDRSRPDCHYDRSTGSCQH